MNISNLKPGEFLERFKNLKSLKEFITWKGKRREPFSGKIYDTNFYYEFHRDIGQEGFIIYLRSCNGILLGTKRIDDIDLTGFIIEDNVTRFLDEQELLRTGVIIK